MPNVWFNGRWVAVDDNQLGTLASYGAAAAVRDHVQAQQKPKQSARQPRVQAEVTEGQDAQQLAELEHRHGAVQQMQRDRRYRK